MCKKISDSLLKDNYHIDWVGEGIYEGCHIGGYRYELKIGIESKCDKEKILACIMMNPSTTFPDDEWEDKNWKKNLKMAADRQTRGFDPTVRNVVRMAHSKKYTEVCIFNLFPYIQPKGKDAIKYFTEKKKDNKQHIEKWVKDNRKNCSEVLVAWGRTLPTGKENKEKYKGYQKEYMDIFNSKDIKPVYYAWNEKADCPYHPSQQVNSTISIKYGKIVKRKKGNKTIGIIQDFINDKKKDFKPIRENYFAT